MSKVGRRIRKLRKSVEIGRKGLVIARKTGLLSAMRLPGAVAFVRSLSRASRGPQQIIRLHAFNTPDKLAVISEGQRVTYGEMDRRICQLAHALRRLGIGPGAKVAVMMRNCREYLETQFAVAHLGATIVQVGYRLKASEVEYILDNSEAQAFLFGEDFSDVARAALDKITMPKTAQIVVGQLPGLVAYEALLASAGRVKNPPPAGGESMGALMMYTSGTTGKPKGALRDFRRTGIEPVLSMMERIPLSHEDRHLVCCPLYHGAAPAFTTLTFFVGGTIVILPHFEPEEALRAIHEERVTSAMMVPTMYSRILNLPEEVRRKYETSSLRWLMSGAAPLPTALAGKIEERFGRILYNFYGATETGLVTMALPGEHTSRPGTIGRLLDGNEIRLLDDGGREVGTGEVGELWVQNSMLMKEYYRNQEATSNVQRDGFVSVGDMARRDAEGHYYLADRKIDMVISGGVNIYPLEIEEHLHTHASVLDCAVIGVPDEEWGESLCAFVVRHEGQMLTADEVRTFVKQTLADYKKPKHVFFVETLPRTPTGKVLKRELRERAAVSLRLSA